MSKMSLSTRMILVLTLITLLSGAILAGWDSFTKPKVEFHRQEALKKAIAEVLPAHDHYETIESEDITLYLARSGEMKSLIGIAFQASGSGFQGEVRIMVGAEPGFENLTGIKVLEQIETPGLGTKIVDDPSNKDNPLWWPEQFKGIATRPEIVVLKNATPSAPNEIQGITGATITSKAVAQIIGKDLERAREVFDSIEDAGANLYGIIKTEKED